MNGILNSISIIILTAGLVSVSYLFRRTVARLEDRIRKLEDGR